MAHFEVVWQETLIERVIIDLMNHYCRPHHVTEGAFRRQWKTPGWHLDSLETYQAATHVSHFFNLHHVSEPEELLSSPSLKAWTSCVMEALEDSRCEITFSTSGSTGKPSYITHKLTTLLQEAEYWQQRYQSLSEWYSVVPSHHIYGFIWGVLVPSLMSIQSIDGRDMLHNQLFQGDSDRLVVAIPNYLPHYLSWPPHQSDVHLTVSGGPCDFTLIQETVAAGFASVTQIYGSTETGGVGYREHTDPHYRLLPYLHQKDGIICRGDNPLPIQDVLCFDDDSRFDVVGRHDKKIQINGKNVSLSEVKGQVLGLSTVSDCAVKVFEQSGLSELHLFVVPALHTQFDMEAFQSQLKQDCPHVSFSHVVLGDKIPANSMGKVGDW